MEIKTSFKAKKIDAKGKTFEELEAEVRAINEANIQAYLEKEEQTNEK